MKVTCSNKYEYWCPHGAENCECDIYNGRDLRDGEDFVFTCTDIDGDERKCNLSFVPENETELKVKKIVDMMIHGIDISEIPKKLNCNNISLKDFLDTLSKTEFKYMKINSDYREKLY